MKKAETKNRGLFVRVMVVTLLTLLVLVPTVSFATGIFDNAHGFGQCVGAMCYFFSPILILSVLGVTLLTLSWQMMTKMGPTKGWLV